MLIDNAYIYPDEIICYHASDIHLYIDSDAAYLVFSKARSCAAGYFYLSNKLDNMYIIPTPKLNGSILIECHTLCNFM